MKKILIVLILTFVALSGFSYALTENETLYINNFCTSLNSTTANCSLLIEVFESFENRISTNNTASFFNISELQAEINEQNFKNKDKFSNINSEINELKEKMVTNDTVAEWQNYFEDYAKAMAINQSMIYADNAKKQAQEHINIFTILISVFASVLISMKLSGNAKLPFQKDKEELVEVEDSSQNAIEITRHQKKDMEMKKHDIADKIANREDLTEKERKLLWNKANDYLITNEQEMEKVLKGIRAKDAIEKGIVNEFSGKAKMFGEKVSDKLKSNRKRKRGSGKRKQKKRKIKK